ncbi:hypothetical protein [Oceanobacillus damuensis]|uniref:hypothetical protein n=1 Tax=Oceanobacillus damuensis TaxID=937928 RepID=UPI0008341009|nr:hypothetical protein [Oceanobacillus damuensis]
MKKIIWLILLLIIIGIGVIIFNQERTTTYGEVMTNLIGEGEEISEIYIKYYSPNDEKSMRTMRLTEDDEIKKVIELSSDMKMKRTTDDSRDTYFVIIESNKDSYDMRLSNNGHIRMDSEDGKKRYYKILGENTFLNVIETFNDKWK